MSAEESTRILDAWVLAENKIVTYRLLSRLLRIKVDLSKDLMAGWHARNPKTHATYVLSGTNSRPSISSQSSIDNSSPSGGLTTSREPRERGTPSVKTRTIRLVPEAELEAAKSLFDEVTSCHVYSIEPAKLTDISIIASVSHDIAKAMEGQSTKIRDLADTYGIIFNAAVHELDENPRRTKPQKAQMKPIIKSESKETALGSKKATSNTAAAASKSNVHAKAEPTSLSTSKASSEKTAPNLKRTASNSLASAFTKTQKPRPKVSAPAEVAPATSDEVAAPVKVQQKNRLPTDTKEQRRVREENRALRDMMMEDDDDADVNADSPAVDQSQTAERPNQPAADETMAESEDWSASDSEMPDARATVPVPTSASNTKNTAESDAQPPKKRSKKKVKRQVHTKDAKGYMITTEEWEWVSCDEDEVAAPAPSLAKQSSLKSSTTKKPAPKKKAGGQAGIAGYFSKR